MDITFALSFSFFSFFFSKSKHLIITMVTPSSWSSPFASPLGMCHLSHKHLDKLGLHLRFHQFTKTKLEPSPSATHMWNMTPSLFVAPLFLPRWAGASEEISTPATEGFRQRDSWQGKALLSFDYARIDNHWWVRNPTAGFGSNSGQSVMTHHKNR